LAFGAALGSGDTGGACADDDGVEHNVLAGVQAPDLHGIDRPLRLSDGDLHGSRSEDVACDEHPRPRGATFAVADRHRARKIRRGVGHVYDLDGAIGALVRTRTAAIAAVANLNLPSIAYRHGIEGTRCKAGLLGAIEAKLLEGQPTEPSVRPSHARMPVAMGTGLFALVTVEAVAHLAHAHPATGAQTVAEEEVLHDLTCRFLLGKEAAPRGRHEVGESGGPAGVAAQELGQEHRRTRQQSRGGRCDAVQGRAVAAGCDVQVAVGEEIPRSKRGQVLNSVPIDFVLDCRRSSASPVDHDGHLTGQDEAVALTLRVAAEP
jgi:hypothetical protein